MFAKNLIQSTDLAFKVKMLKIPTNFPLANVSSLVYLLSPPA